MIKRMFRWSKWCSAALVMLLLLVSLLVGLALFTNLGLNSLVSLAEKAMPQLSVGSAEGALLPKFTLREVRFQDDALHLETSLDELGLAIDMGCFWQGRLCVDDLRLHGLALSLPELAPSQQEPEPESPPLTMIRTPLPIAVRNLDLSDIKLDILGNQIDWREFRSGLAMRGDRLTITPTRFNDVNVTLAESEPSSANPPVAEPKQDIVLPEVWIPLTIELQRFDLNRFTLHQATPVEITHLGLELKAAQHQVQVSHAGTRDAASERSDFCANGAPRRLSTRTHAQSTAKRERIARAGDQSLSQPKRSESRRAKRSFRARASAGHR